MLLFAGIYGWRWTWRWFPKFYAATELRRLSLDSYYSLSFQWHREVWLLDNLSYLCLWLLRSQSIDSLLWFFLLTSLNLPIRLNLADKSWHIQVLRIRKRISKFRFMLLKCSLSLWAKILLSYLLRRHLIVQFFLLINPCCREEGTLYISLGALAFLLERGERLFEVAFIFCLRISKHHIYSWNVCFKLVSLKSGLW